MSGSHCHSVGQHFSRAAVAPGSEYEKDRFFGPMPGPGNQTLGLAQGAELHFSAGSGACSSLRSMVLKPHSLSAFLNH